MNVQKVVKELKRKYPGKNIVINTPDNPTEIICEVDTGKRKSFAVAVVDNIRPHYHKKLTETYEITKGILIHHLGKKKRILKVGESVVILPKNVHWAEGTETWFNVYSTPGWRPEDHILVFPSEEISRAEFDK